LADAPGTPLFLNTHPQELQERGLVQPDDPICLHDAQVFLEITESAPLTHFDLCTNVLREVCARSGAFLVVDDLGAGYSNFKRIAELEPQVVKLDRELIRNVDEHPRQQRLVAGMIALCGELGAKVVAEGIETEAELSAVIDAGAELGQGYFLGRPELPPCPSPWRPTRSI
jgi:EAL domain-containing protein (putative c-di-GMP-specific phosphodiesterase class I)